MLVEPKLRNLAKENKVYMFLFVNIANCSRIFVKAL